MNLNVYVVVYYKAIQMFSKSICSPDPKQSVSEVMNFWLNHNSIPASNLVTTELNDGAVVRGSYTGGNENTSVVLYTVREENGKAGGHVWFSDDIDGKSPNQILWDFLATYNLND